MPDLLSIEPESWKQVTRPTNNHCPSCGHAGLTLFYEVKQIPFYSCLLPDSRQEALDCPCRDLTLGFCPACGFISNVLFDPELVDYSVSYEDQQGFSPTFNAFAQRIANHLIERYDVRHKSILEIGCGKGDFLALICDLGQNQGVGIDPSVVEGRLPSTTVGKVELIQDYYSERYADYPSNLICCRHTLEHIPATADFLQVLRRSMCDRLDTIVFFEVPDATRILRDGVFWDIYYEHCSYFTPGSLARLFRANGFEVLDLYREYGEQYLMIEARPVTTPSPTIHPLEESVEQLAQDVLHFATHIRKKLDNWRQYFAQQQAAGRKVVIWGSGSKCVGFLTTLAIRDQIKYVVDINPYRQGKFVLSGGAEIVSPEYLQEYQPDEVVLMNPIYEQEVCSSLKAMGINAPVIPAI